MFKLAYLTVFVALLVVEGADRPPQRRIKNVKSTDLRFGINSKVTKKDVTTKPPKQLRQLYFPDVSFSVNKKKINPKPQYGVLTKPKAITDDKNQTRAKKITKKRRAKENETVKRATKNSQKKN